MEPHLALHEAKISNSDARSQGTAKKNRSLNDFEELSGSAERWAFSGGPGALDNKVGYDLSKVKF